MHVVAARRALAGLVLACCLAGCLTGPAAADEAAVDWTGFYIGVHAGAFWGDAAYREPTDPPYDFDGEMDGFVGGAYAGYAYQIGNAVLGLEVDGGAGDVSFGASDPVYNDYTELDLTWNAHLRAKAGYAFERGQLFAAGGLALAGTEIDDRDSGWGRDRDTRVGWTVGGGLNIAVTPSLRVGLEYLYDDYGTQSGDISVPGGAGAYPVKLDLDAHTLRAGLAWQF